MTVGPQRSSVLSTMAFSESISNVNLSFALNATFSSGFCYGMGSRSEPASRKGKSRVKLFLPGSGYYGICLHPAGCISGRGEAREIHKLLLSGGLAPGRQPLVRWAGPGPGASAPKQVPGRASVTAGP